MENKKTVDQNPENAVTPEENINAVSASAKNIDGKEEQKTEATEKEAEVTEQETEVTEQETEVTEQKAEVTEQKAEVTEQKAEATEQETEVTEQKAEATEQEAEAVSKEEVVSEEEKKASEEASEEDTADKADDHEEEEEEAEEAFEEFSAEELISRLEELVQAEEFSKVKTKVALVKVAFLKILKEEKQTAIDKFVEEGGKKEDFKAEENPFEKRFNKAFEIYRKNKIRFNEEQEKIRLVNLEKKKEILNKLKELISSEESLKKTYDEFRSLQAEWKEIGMVPSGEVSNLWQSYHFLVEKFFDKVKINKELRDLDMKKNLELKVKICEKTEELLLETSIIKSFKQLQKFHEEWKDTGPVPQEQNEEVWERFKAATDKINELRREHYGKLQEDQEKNLLAKTDLCEQAEEVLTITPDSMKGWQEQTNKINELFGVWRSIGRAPKKQNTEIWERFKGSMNTFFSNKKEFLSSIKQEQLNHYNLKVDLCVEAEAIKDSTDWKKTTQELIRLQQEWKKIGPVPRKHSDKIWKRFRSACDEFFNNKSSHFSNVHENEQQNLEKKQEIIDKVKAHKFTDEKSKNLDILKNFQREWLEIGFVPMKDKDKVQKLFREVVDARLDELKISSAELSNASYATRMEAVKDSPEADRVYRKEISFLNNKINKLRDDVNLWENNLGFFANSKKADVLKQEFEQKIEKARQDLAAMEAKVKYLRKMSAE
ncbi:MAG: DUF349 domain-containing protein [Bacteroidota bacterium]